MLRRNFLCIGDAARAGRPEAAGQPTRSDRDAALFAVPVGARSTELKADTVMWGVNHRDSRYARCWRWMLPERSGTPYATAVTWGSPGHVFDRPTGPRTLDVHLGRIDRAAAAKIPSC